MKKYGRLFGMSNPLIDMLIACATPRYFAEEGDGAPAAPAEEPSDMDKLLGPAPDGDGNPNPDPAADASADADPSNPDTANEPTDPPDGQDPEVDDDELSTALKGDETAEAKLARLERDHGASSKEARRLGDTVKAYKKAFEAQGLKPVVKDGEVSFVPTEKYSDKPAITEVKLADLPTAKLEALESGDIEQMQPVIDELLKKQQESLVKPQPNLEKEPPAISDEQKAAVFEEMAAAVDVNDEPKHENFEKNQKHIEAAVKDKGLEVAFAENPEFIAELMNMYINDLRAKLIAKKKAAAATVTKKETDAQTSTATNVDNPSAPAPAKTGADAFLDLVGPKRG